MKLRCGIKSNLPALAAPGEPLVTTDTQELYIGTGIGVKKISDILISETEPAFENRFRLWLNPITGLIRTFNEGTWQVVSNQESTDFGGF